MKLAEYINENLSIEDEYYKVFGRTIPNGKMFCPFHDNHNTPAAKKYGNGIKCFGQCNKYYTLYDFLKKFNPERINEVKSSVLLPKEENSVQYRKIRPVIIDRSQSIEQIVSFICLQN